MWAKVKLEWYKCHLSCRKILQIFFHEQCLEEHKWLKERSFKELHFMQYINPFPYTLNSQLLFLLPQDWWTLGFLSWRFSTSPGIKVQNHLPFIFPNIPSTVPCSYSQQEITLLPGQGSRSYPCGQIGTNINYLLLTMYMVSKNVPI